jgi:hypothetical protein
MGLALFDFIAPGTGDPNSCLFRFSRGVKSNVASPRNRFCEVSEIPTPSITRGANISSVPDVKPSLISALVSNAYETKKKGPSYESSFSKGTLGKHFTEISPNFRVYFPDLLRRFNGE